jgi:hypothetical protein
MVKEIPSSFDEINLYGGTLRPTSNPSYCENSILDLRVTTQEVLAQKNIDSSTKGVNFCGQLEIQME